MVPDSKSSKSAGARSPVLNAIIGGIAGVILSFIPLSPILGGAIAGYLQDGTGENGVKVGAGAGLVMLLPFLFIGFFLVMILGFGGISHTYGMEFGATPFFVGLIGLFAIALTALYTVGLSALGGYLGVYVRREL
ncbi:MAG: DUF5518 domain-containing protein [Halodesulfurarchaeum sp.]|nr:DUF5518 domain-containing protein [Halodesulfurarchaeum sp.]